MESNMVDTAEEKVQDRAKWYEKDTDDWDEDDRYEALCDLFETYH